MGGSVYVYWHIFSDEGFLYRILEIFYNHGTSLICIKPMLVCDAYQSNMTDVEKLSIFWDMLSKCTGHSVQDCFTETELELIFTKYSL